MAAECSGPWGALCEEAGAQAPPASLAGPGSAIPSPRGSSEEPAVWVCQAAVGGREVDEEL